MSILLNVMSFHGCAYKCCEGHLLCTRPSLTATNTQAPSSHLSTPSIGVYSSFISPPSQNTTEEQNAGNLSPIDFCSSSSPCIFPPPPQPVVCFPFPQPRRGLLFSISRNEERGGGGVVCSIRACRQIFYRSCCSPGAAQA